MSGPFGKPLIEAGWSPGAVVLTRLWIASLVTLVPMLVFARDRLATLRSAPRSVIAYGLVAVLATNLSYFYAVSRMSVTVALLIEFSAPVVVIGYLWMRFGRRPSVLTTAGAVVAIAGLALVVGASDGGARVTPGGVAWALLALVGCAGYFLLAHDGSDGDEAPEADQMALAVGGMTVGAIALTALWAVGAVPVRIHAVDVHMGHLGTVPWWVPAVVVGAVATGLAYVAGIVAINMVGPTLASFLAFSEVLMATVAAWFLLGESLAPAQFGGAVLIMAGVMAVKRGERRAVPVPGDAPVPAPPRRGRATLRRRPDPRDRQPVG